MTRTTLILAAAVLLAALAPNPPASCAVGAQDAPAPAPAPMRIGVYDMRGIALAYGRSGRPDCMMAKVEDIRKAHEQAKDDGDEERMAELEAEAQAQQKRIHEQVFAAAPIPEILALLKPDLPRVAEAAGVQVIVAEMLYKDPGVDLVDITPHMCAPFEPDGETVRMIEELLLTKPVPLSELSHDHE